MRRTPAATAGTGRGWQTAAQWEKEVGGGGGGGVGAGRAPPPPPAGRGARPPRRGGPGRPPPPPFVAEWPHLWRSDCTRCRACQLALSAHVPRTQQGARARHDGHDDVPQRGVQQVRLLLVARKLHTAPTRTTPHRPRASVPSPPPSHPPLPPLTISVTRVTVDAAPTASSVATRCRTNATHSPCSLKKLPVLATAPAMASSDRSRDPVRQASRTNNVRQVQRGCTRDCASLGWMS
jgi:hypothetical protein